MGPVIHAQVFRERAGERLEGPTFTASTPHGTGRGGPAAVSAVRPRRRAPPQDAPSPPVSIAAAGPANNSRLVSPMRLIPPEGMRGRSAAAEGSQATIGDRPARPRSSLLTPAGPDPGGMG